MISLKAIRFAYGKQPVLSDIHLEIAAGSFIGIIGPNGAGKSTLLRIMAAIHPPAAGEILFFGQSLATYARKALSRRLAYVPQSFQTVYHFSVLDIVKMGRYPHLNPLQKERPRDLEIMRSVMAETAVWEFRDRPFTELSGGERQRVVLASALAQEPQVLMLDEPTSALDIDHQVRFYTILQRLQAEKNLTIITVTHDINLAARYCKRIVVLKDGRIVADDEPERIVTPALIGRVYAAPVAVLRHPRDGKPIVAVG